MDNGNLSNNNNTQQLMNHTPMEIDSQINLSEENETQMLRLIQQYLTDHGYQDVALNLQTRSNVLMEDDLMNAFRTCILQSSSFAQARDLLKQLTKTTTNTSKYRQNNNEQIQGEQQQQQQQQQYNKEWEWQEQVEYIMYEQEYLERVEKADKIGAVQLLQRELMPRARNVEQRERLHQLAQLIMYQEESGSRELQRLANWKGSGLEGRQDLLERLQALMPASEMLPPHRLEQLVKQSLAYQIYNCKYHNVNMTSGGYAHFSLLEDHQCQKQMMIPTKCIAVLTKHKDEVWQVKFSASGMRLATLGKDNIVYLWQLIRLKPSSSTIKYQSSLPKYRLRLTHDLRGHSRQVNAVNWSPSGEDRHLVTASHDGAARVWDARSGRLVAEAPPKRSGQQEAVTAAAFVGENRFVTGSVDKLIILWEMRITSSQNGLYEVTELARVETRNYLDIAVCSASRFVTMGQNHFQVFNYKNMGDIAQCMEDSEMNYEVEMSDTVTSIALSKDGRYLLANVSLKDARLELFDLGSGGSGSSSKRAELIRRYKGGHEQSMFVLRCAFGGANEQFVLCGSEDATVAIWSKDKAEIVAKIGGGLENHHQIGHTQVVNCVSWSPADPKIFATASDDQTVRIWGVENMPMCDVVMDNKEVKRVDLTRSNGGGMENGLRIYSQQDDEEEEDDNDSDDYDPENADEDDDQESDNILEEEGEEESMMEEDEERYRHNRRRRGNNRRSNRRRTGTTNEEDIEEVEEEEEDWVEGSQQ